MADEVYIRGADSQTNGSVRLVLDDSAATVQIERRIDGEYTSLAPSLGGTVVTATADELNDLDLSAKTQAITEAGAIDPDMHYVTLTGPESSTYAVTLAAPNRPGQLLTIEMIATTSTNSVTMLLTNVVGGSETVDATWDAADETLVLLSNATAWMVIKELGVTLGGA